MADGHHLKGGGRPASPTAVTKAPCLLDTKSKVVSEVTVIWAEFLSVSTRVKLTRSPHSSLSHFVGDQ